MTYVLEGIAKLQKTARGVQGSSIYDMMTRTRTGASTSEQDQPAWTNLLPELLLALLGCSGGAFVYTDIGDGGSEGGPGVATPLAEGVLSKRLVLADVVDWVSDAEREQLNRIVKLGWYYDWLYGYAVELTSFLSLSAVVAKGGTGAFAPGRSGAQHSPYQVAVAQACLEILDVYREAVLGIEARIVDARADEMLWSLLPLEQALSEFAEIFPFLYERISGWTRGENACGCREIFETFETAARSGMPVIEGCSLRIAWHCYQVLFKQMHAWMMHGRLVDPTGEFFIHMETGEREQARDGLRYISASVVESRLPVSISLHFARDVLYVGQCTRILDSLGDQKSEAASHIGAGASDEGRARFEEELKQIWTSALERLDWIALKNLVNARKLVLSDRVWTEMHRTDRNLVGHVDDFVDIVLQNRGALYAELVEAVGSVAYEDPDPERAAALAAQLFREAAYFDHADVAQDAMYGAGYTEMQSTIHVASAGLWEERTGGQTLAIVTMTWYDTRDNLGSITPVWHPKHDHDIHVPSYDKWDGLCIRYDMRWPMHLVFPVKAMRVYGALWQLMFRTSRALHDMKDVREAMKRQRYPRKMIALHHRLFHFLSTYAMYLQEEIVACSKGKIYGILTTSSSLIEAEAKHMDFVSEIAQISCIDVKQVIGVLENMFACVKSLATIARSDNGSHQHGERAVSNPVSALQLSDIDSISEVFLSKYNVWYQLLQSTPLQAGRRGEALRRLLLKMNYNGFMDRNAARQVDQHVIHLAG